MAGGSGMVRAVCNTLIEKGYGNEKLGGQILKPKRDKLNLLNAKEVDDWFHLNKPSITILAAAKVEGFTQIEISI